MTPFVLSSFLSEKIGTQAPDKNFKTRYPSYIFSSCFQPELEEEVANLWWSLVMVSYFHLIA